MLLNRGGYISPKWGAEGTSVKKYDIVRLNRHQMNLQTLLLTSTVAADLSWVCCDEGHSEISFFH